MLVSYVLVFVRTSSQWLVLRLYPVLVPVSPVKFQQIQPIKAPRIKRPFESAGLRNTGP